MARLNGTPLAEGISSTIRDPVSVSKDAADDPGLRGGENGRLPGDDLSAMLGA